MKWHEFYDFETLWRWNLRNNRIFFIGFCNRKIIISESPRMHSSFLQLAYEVTSDFSGKKNLMYHQTGQHCSYWSAEVVASLYSLPRSTAARRRLLRCSGRLHKEFSQMSLLREEKLFCIPNYDTAIGWSRLCFGKLNLQGILSVSVSLSHRLYSMRYCKITDIICVVIIVNLNQVTARGKKILLFSSISLYREAGLGISYYIPTILRSNQLNILFKIY